MQVLYRLCEYLRPLWMGARPATESNDGVAMRTLRPEDVSTSTSSAHGRAVASSGTEAKGTASTAIDRYINIGTYSMENRSKTHRFQPPSLAGHRRKRQREGQKEENRIRFPSTVHRWKRNQQSPRSQRTSFPQRFPQRQRRSTRPLRCKPGGGPGRTIRRWRMKRRARRSSTRFGRCILPRQLVHM